MSNLKADLAFSRLPTEMFTMLQVAEVETTEKLNRRGFADAQASYLDLERALFLERATVRGEE